MNEVNKISYNSDDIQLWHGDCLELMKDIADKSVDAIICDLPYGVLNKGNKHAQWDRMLPLDKLWDQYNRVIKDNGAIILFGQGMFTAQLMMSNPKMWRYNLIWDKKLTTGFLNAKRMPLRCHEDVLVFYKSLPVYHPQMNKGNPLHSRGELYKTKECKNNNYGSIKSAEDKRIGSTSKYPTSVLRFSKDHPSISVHQTQKPVALIEWLIKTYSNEGDTILDNTFGSGTTAVACVSTNRKLIGMELGDKYFEIACKRVEEAINNKQLELF